MRRAFPVYGCFILSLAVTANGQVVSPTPTPSPEPAASQKKEKRYSLIPIPIPINSPTFGTGMILGLGLVMKLNENDTKSPPSSFAVVSAFTNNGSRGLALAGKMYFAENKYQTRFAAGAGKAVYEYFGIGRVPGQPAVSREIRQTGRFVFGEFMRNVWKDVFIGPRYQYRRLTANLGDSTTPGGFVIPPIDLVSTTAAIGFRVERDMRDNEFYPTKGSVFSVKADFFGKAIGSNRTYQTYAVDYNGYRTIGEKQVIAYRGSVCSVSDNAPFFDLCFYGARGDLRGYTAGEFQDRRMFAAQAEYRRELKWRLGVVAFGGIGGIAPEWSHFRSDQLLPAAGVGLRFKVDKKNHINYRIDLGFGRGGHTVTMSVGEAF
ncbi:MAG TPA: BamA/TamA family outer membrane protein [Pyrinomonadaceae bacterium]|nr:BamA/TamA family outer membrane protein [Pyrinomonadaceae bacterium]